MNEHIYHTLEPQNEHSAVVDGTVYDSLCKLDVMLPNGQMVPATLVRNDTLSIFQNNLFVSISLEYVMIAQLFILLLNVIAQHSSITEIPYNMECIDVLYFKTFIVTSLVYHISLHKT